MAVDINAKQVKELREMTGVGMMECKKALIESNANIDKAVIWLREHGMARAAKKADRVASQGIVEVVVSPDKNEAVIFEVNCETDFVAKNDEFKTFVDEVGKVAIKSKAKSVEEFTGLKMANGHTTQENLTNLIAKIGENMHLRRYQRFSAKNGIVSGYVHFGSKIATVVVLDGSKDSKVEEIGKEIAMHTAAAAPKYLCPKCVPAAELEQEKEIARKKLADQKKPANILEKIVEGQMNKFYKEVCLLEQAFVRDTEVSIKDYVKKSGLPIELTAFARFQVGEGVAKKEESCAAQ